MKKLRSPPARWTSSTSRGDGRSSCGASSSSRKPHAQMRSAHLGSRPKLQSLDHLNSVLTSIALAGTDRLSISRSPSSRSCHVSWRRVAKTSPTETFMISCMARISLPAMDRMDTESTSGASSNASATNFAMSILPSTKFKTLPDSVTAGSPNSEMHHAGQVGS